MVKMLATEMSWVYAASVDRVFFFGEKLCGLLGGRDFVWTMR